MYQNKVLPKRLGTFSFVQDGRICQGLPDLKRPYLMEVCSCYSHTVSLTFSLIPVQGYRNADDANTGGHNGYQLTRSVVRPLYRLRSSTTGRWTRSMTSTTPNIDDLSASGVDYQSLTIYHSERSKTEMRKQIWWWLRSRIYSYYR